MKAASLTGHAEGSRDPGIIGDCRTVLFIAYNFPPHGGAGVQRSTHFVRYLPDFGWRPLVITATEDASMVQDCSLLAKLPDEALIYRVPGFSISRLQLRARRFKLDRAVVGLNLLLQLPDPNVFWARNAFRVAEAVIEQHNPNLVYTTSGPYSSHLIGRWIREKYGIPWLADFRDPWSRNLLMPYLPGYRALNRHLERQVLDSADRVACVSEPWLGDLRQNCSDERDKFVTITNGYDENDVDALPMPSGQAKFTIGHFGTFYTNRRPDQLVAAIDKLIDSNRIEGQALRVLFVGKNAQTKVPDRPPYETHGYVPHRDLARFRQGTEVLLLILATSPENVGNYSGKIYEYIASNRPILAIVPEGGVAQQLIEDSRTGIAVNGDVEAIAGAIEQLHQQWQAGFPDWNPNWDVIRRYTRRNLTARLAAEFDKMAAETTQ